MKNRLTFSFVLLCVLILTLSFVSCHNPVGVGTHTVRYVITGPATIARLVVYANETGNIDQITDVPIPWEKTITIQGREFVSCSASLDSRNTLTYTAKIFVDDKEIASANSSSVEVSAWGFTQ